MTAPHTLPVLVATWLAMWMSSAACAQPLLVDLSRPRVSITSAFRGADVLVFGAIDGPGDVVITVTGASTRQTVLRKERVFGLWVNAGRLTFDDVPSFYAVAATRPLEQILPPGGVAGIPVTLDERLLSMRALGAQRRRPIDVTDFRQGLIEAKRREGLFSEAISPVTVVGARLFRAELRFPSKLPVGDYEVRAYVFRDGQVVSAVSRPLVVSKAGFSARIFEWSRELAPIYGVVAIVLALVIGWLAGTLTRRI
ncbi:MAG: TIGR02186 family protein [Alphaproteobacteria bacterium]|nr:TIGR02186 family protein [Alphaproteobacteria bacterium]